MPRLGASRTWHPSETCKQTTVSLAPTDRADDPAFIWLFVSTFEGLWGRRLAGLTGGDGPTLDGDVVLKTHVLAQAELSGAWR